MGKAVEGSIATEVYMECIGGGSMAMGSWILAVELTVVVCYSCEDRNGRERTTTRRSGKEMVIRID